MRFFKDITMRQDGLTLYRVEREHSVLPHSTTRFGPAVWDTYLLECCTGGAGSVTINGTEFPVKGGDCYFLMPGDIIIHTNFANNHRRGVWCSMYGMQIGSWLTQAGISSQQPFAPRESFTAIAVQMEHMMTLEEQGAPGMELKQTACLYNIFAELLSRSRVPQDRSDSIRRAIGLMESCYDKPISVTRLAAEAGLERSYFSTQFKQQTGMSPHQYLTELRLQKACVLMDHGCPVSEAAEAVGIPPENFSRLFKRCMGQTPGAYKARRQSQ